MELPKEGMEDLDQEISHPIPFVSKSGRDRMMDVWIRVWAVYVPIGMIVK
jgi:hypothetical protein